jgi:type IV secretory pathway TrbL component
MDERDEQNFFGLLMGAWVAILVAMVLIGLRGFVGCGTGNDFVGETSLVVLGL